MLLFEPAPTPYDLNFRIGQFPVRVSPWFWLMALLIGGMFRDGLTLLIWMLVVFLSILVHELGHAIAFQRFGIASHIVLYQMGGLAIPDQFSTPWQSGRARRDPQTDIVISLAGPLAQMGSALILGAIIWGLAQSRSIPVTSWNELVQATHDVFGSQQLAIFAISYLYVSIFWALLNLLPVFPLDGGQIARNLFLLYGGSNAIQQSLFLSVFTAGVVAVFGFTRGQSFLGILFAMLAYGSYQALEQYRGSGGGRF